MSSFKEAYNEEVSKLFGMVERKAFSGESPDKVVQEQGPPAALVPFSFNGSDVFDETDSMDVLVYIPDEMTVIVKARAVLAFREFFAPATTVASGGGSTSGSSSASSSGASSSSTSSTSSIGLNMTACPHHVGHAHISSLDGHSHGIEHTHGIGHTHTTPAHAHDLEYGVFKETMPASHSVSMNIYKWDGSAWASVAAITGLTDDVEDVDLSDYITTPGKYRLSLYSPLGSPNNGRLGCDVAGHIVGAIQPR